MHWLYFYEAINEERIRSTRYQPRRSRRARARGGR
jgi:hypothetical protein